MASFSSGPSGCFFRRTTAVEMSSNGCRIFLGSNPRSPNRKSPLAPVFSYQGMILIEAVGMHTSQEGIDLVADYYPSRIVSPKTKYFIEEIFQKMGISEDPDEFVAPKVPAS